MSLVQAEPAPDQHLLGRAARLSVLYSNDFDGLVPQGRSGGPRGSGPLASDADSMVPFHYRVVVDTVANRTRAAIGRPLPYPFSFMPTKSMSAMRGRSNSKLWQVRRGAFGRLL